MPATSSPFLSELDRHMAWTAWSWPTPLTNTEHPEHADLAVMTLALAGEAGEVLACVLQWADSGLCPEALLFEEMGDALFCWARVAHATGYHLPEEMPPLNGQRRCSEPPVLSAARLVLGASKVCEVVKKLNRDGQLDSIKFKAAMLETYQAWWQLCGELALDWSVVRLASVAKIEARHAPRLGALAL